MISVMLFVQIMNVKTVDCRITVISQFAENMVMIKQRIYYIVAQSANGLHHREQPPDFWA